VHAEKAQTKADERRLGMREDGGRRLAADALSGLGK